MTPGDKGVSERPIISKGIRHYEIRCDLMQKFQGQNEHSTKRDVQKSEIHLKIFNIWILLAFL